MATLKVADGPRSQLTKMLSLSFSYPEGVVLSNSIYKYEVENSSLKLEYEQKNDSSPFSEMIVGRI